MSGPLILCPVPAALDAKGAERRSYACEILADSLSPAGVRLTTFRIRYPTMAIQDLNTHRALSRNAQSSRAIPTLSRVRQVWYDPYVPVFERNGRGMSSHANAPLAHAEQLAAEHVWRGLARAACVGAAALHAIGVHKQWASNPLNLFDWTTAVVSATEWDNFFAQRCEPDARPELRTIACMMRDALAAGSPEALSEYDWHLPLVGYVESRALGLDVALRVSAARCARLSYGEKAQAAPREVEDDVRLCDDTLIARRHMSPLEHQARPVREGEENDARLASNFTGWVQFRKFIPGESGRRSRA